MGLFFLMGRNTLNSAFKISPNIFVSFKNYMSHHNNVKPLFKWQTIGVTYGCPFYFE